MNYKKVLKYTLSLAVAVLLLYSSFKGVDWAEFLRGAQSCNWAFIALAMAASVLAFFFRSQRWKLLIRPLDPTMDSLTTFNGVNIGYLANFVFPRLGEVVRCGFISKRSSLRHEKDPENAVSFEGVIGTVLLSRTCDILVVFGLIIVLLCARWETFGAFFTSKIGERLQIADFSFGYFVLVSVMVVALGIFAAYKLRHRSRLALGVVNFLDGMMGGFRSFASMQGKWSFVSYTILMWAMYWLMSMAVIWAMPQIEGLGWVDAWFICLSGSVAWMIPVPGGFGAYHGVVALALSSVYSFPWEYGLLYATINHEAQAITMIICGIFSYIVEVFRK